MCSLEKAPDVPLQERQASLLAAPVIARRSNCRMMQQTWLQCQMFRGCLTVHCAQDRHCCLFCAPLTAKQKAEGHFFVYVQGYFLYAPALCIVDIPCATPAPL